MNRPSKISHPLKNRTGTSQRTRRIQALQNDFAPVDGKTLADRLTIISKYALHINFYEYAKNEIEGEYQNLDNWSHFFKKSLPFQLAVLSKISTRDLDKEYILLYNELKRNPSRKALESLFNFIQNKIITPTTVILSEVEKSQNSFVTPIQAILKSSFVEPLKTFISLYNASATFLCIRKRNFTNYLSSPWQFGVPEIYKLYDGVQQVTKGENEAFLLVAKELNAIFYQFLSGFATIIEEAPDFIEESLYPLQETLQKTHEPHVALLFTFLELFTYLQGNINDLGKKHLDFFYEKVLKIIPKEAIPDKAHIVFEVAKHLEEYPLKEGLLLKNGKDANKQDIQFGLDHEIILDKAKVVELRTLALHKLQQNNQIEGVYIAPIANSIDGLGKDFTKDQSTNWATLGAKDSKIFKEDTSFIEHPKARLGFVLSSPVLLLQEGERTIHIEFDCELPIGVTSHTVGDIKDAFEKAKKQRIYSINEDMLDSCLSDISNEAKQYIREKLVQEAPYIIGEDLKGFLMVQDAISCVPVFDKKDKRILCKCLEGYAETSSASVFDISFSGEKSWVIPKPENVLDIAIDLLTNNTLKITIQIKLNADDPSIVFFNDKVLQEQLPLEKPFPIVKIELNSKAKVKQNIFDCGQIDSPIVKDKDKCCLKKGTLSQNEINVSLYHFFQHLTLKRAEIKVDVCGVKNLIVQNDENLQDVNKPILPFGPRPKVGENWKVDGGANFYIGSKEVFCKNWEKFWVKTSWKDKPLDLSIHYDFYKTDPFEDGTNEIENGSFRFQTSILEDGIWKKDIKVKLANPLNPLPSDPERPDLLKLFENYQKTNNDCFTPSAAEDDDKATFYHEVEREATFSPQSQYEPKTMPIDPLQPLTVNTRKGFMKITLAGVSFQHGRFTYVLTKQMMALAKLVDPKSIANAINALEDTKTLADAANARIQSLMTNLENLIDRVELVRDQIGSDGIPNTVVNFAVFVKGKMDDAKSAIAINDGAAAINHLNDALPIINNVIDILGDLNTSSNSTKVQGRLRRILDIANTIKTTIVKFPDSAPNPAIPVVEDNIHEFYIKNHLSKFGLESIVKTIGTRIEQILNDFDTTTELGLPKEPYTPFIRSLSIDYTAKAEMDDIDIIHLYPFTNTSKFEDIKNNPTLFPFHDKEGALFIGIEDLTPGGNLSMLFQLAEATANSEMDRAKIHWEYLSNNNWIELLPDFNIISDETDGLTVSGIITIAVPDTINKTGNTVMPHNLYWLRVSAKDNAMAVAETIGIHTQAAKASARLSKKNDTNRLNTALEAGSVGKLVEADFSVKKVEQLYPSFGGKQPEGEGHYYVRVSEHLKHKGRALMINDYEKIVLEDFPEIYKVKCISHTMGLSAITYQKDLEVAPGFVVVTVIPDLNKLLSGNQLEPKVPVSLLEKIANLLRKKTSPFAKIKVMNPRYEYVDIDITIRLYRGKSADFYKRKLKEDITNLLAPWFLGDSEKIAFGQSVLFSDIVGFVEQLEYVNFITKLELKDEQGQKASQIIPLTARSILTAGKICVDIDKEECPEPNQKKNSKTSMQYKNINEPLELS